MTRIVPIIPAGTTARLLDRLTGRDEPAPAPTIHIAPAVPKQRTGGLGPNQLQWCREHLGVFATCERQALEAERHRAEMKGMVRP